MATFVAFYIRKTATEPDPQAAILQLYPSAEIEQLPEFVGGFLTPDDYQAPEQNLCALSGRLATDIVWVTYQTAAESFIYHHWHNGHVVRSLVYGCDEEGLWEKVEGQAEPWEEQAFWSDADLEAALDWEEDHAIKQTLRNHWATKIIREGESIPSISSMDAVSAAMAHFGLFSADEIYE